MTDIWDFSNLIESWREKDHEVTEPKDEETEIIQQMQKEIGEIDSVIEKLQNNELDDLKNYNLLATPKPEPHEAPVFSREQSEEKANEPEKTTKTAGKSSTLAKSPRIVKPKAVSSTKITTRNFEKTPKISQTPKQENLKPVFSASPEKMEVVNFQISQTYVTDFKLQNIDFKTHGFQVKFPKDPAFTVRFDGGTPSSRTISGLGIKFTVIFKPTEQKDYDNDEIVFQPDNGAPPTVIPLHCYRDPPRLKHPDIVDLGATLVHSLKPGKFTIKNYGGVAFFAFNSPTGRDDNMMYTNGSFTLIPSQFQLQHGESKEIEVKFKPTEPGTHTASFEITAEHFPQKFSFLAKGEAAVPCLKFTISPDERLFLPFLPQDVNTTRSIEIYNEADVQYPFHVQILKPREGTRSDLAVLYPDTDLQSIKNAVPPFIVSPVSGIIGARDKITLNITFSPKMFAFYKANIVIFANRIPDETGKQCSRKMLTIAAEGTTGPPAVLIQPPLVLFNSVVPYTKTIESIDVVNESHLDIKLQWRKSDTISPSPLIFDVASNDRVNVDLACILTKKIGGQLSNGRGIKTMGMLCSSTDPQNANEPRPPSSQHYSINMSALDVGQQDEAQNKVVEVNESEKADDKEEQQDEMPNIFGLRHWSSNIDKTEYTTSITLQNRAKEDVNPAPADATPMNFTYYAHTLPPNLVLDPPVVDFGSVLTGINATKVLKLTNAKSCPIRYRITYPEDSAWTVKKAEGIVEAESTEDVEISLTFESQTALEDIITLRTAWADELGNAIESLAPAVFAIPVFAVFDCPIINVNERIVDIGEVYPTLEYQAKINISLMNSFPTDFELICPESSIDLKLVDEEDSQPKLITKYVHAEPQKGYLDLGQSQTINLKACFSELGKQAMALKTKIIGKTYTVAVISHVVAPKVTLITKSIDFSSDFVICNESHSLIKVANECDVPSSIRVEMIDDCKGVFKLGDNELKYLSPNSQVEIPVSCYSEIHGDYYGKVRLIIRDYWQHREIDIPLHVKALGSFFGFQKHTLGYTSDPSQDYVSFGTRIAASDKPLIRRLTLVNFSSEAIEVEWSLANYVKGRKYADVSLSITDDGNVDLSITETPEANMQSPFKLETQKTVIESHGRTVVEIEFDPSQRGEFSGCISARSGEFIHTLGLKAIVI